jgi:uncharacterized protein YndB with AHSA1/START domain
MADIKHQIGIEGSPDAVFALITSGKGLAQWWAEDVFEDSDSVVSLGFFGRTTVYRLRRQEAVSHSRAVWKCETGKEWEGTRLVFELTTSGKQTIVRFAHEGWQGETDYFRSCNTTWGELMFRLKAAAEGKGKGPLFRAKDLAY